MLLIDTVLFGRGSENVLIGNDNGNRLDMAGISEDAYFGNNRDSAVCRFELWPSVSCLPEKKEKRS